MCTYRKNKIILLLGVLGVFLASCHNYRAPVRQWGVLAVGLPEKITISRARGNTTYYILKQTHEPIFRKNDGQNYSSRVLKSWTRNIDYTQYVFCPKTSLHFNDSVVFTTAAFHSHINTVTGRFDPNFVLTQKDGCSIVGFKKSKTGYLDFLTLYENAPSVNQSENIELGLGPFYVQSLTEESIVLARKRPIRNGYNEIVLYEYRGENDSNLQNHNIKDFNLIPDFDLPKWVIDEYAGFTNVELKTVALIINHPDKEIRKSIYNCVDVAKLREAFFPKKSDFHNIQTILPVGIAGAKAGKPVQFCNRKTISSKTNTPIVFANWMYGNDNQLNEFTDEFYKKTGIKITITNFPPKKLVKVFNKYPRPYNLVIIVFDAVRSNPSAFFESFTKSDGFHDFEIPKIKELYKMMNDEDDSDKRKTIVSKMVNEIINQAVALPLYQSVKKIYYPKEIKNIEVGRGFLEYPEVAKFRI